MDDVVNAGTGDVFRYDSFGAVCPTCYGITAASAGRGHGNQQVDAAYNYWSTPSGPYNATSNPGGTGPQVTDTVSFTPWLGAATYASDSATTTDLTVPATASVGGTGSGTTGSQSITGSVGTGSVTVATYSGNPSSVAPPSGVAGFLDFRVSPGSTFTTVSVEDCNLGGGSTTLYWFDGSTWQTVTPQTTSNGCTTATLLPVGTSPTIGQITGTPFAGGTPGPTVSRVASFTVHRSHGRVLLKWRLAQSPGVAGFNLFARNGTHAWRLNARLIPVHASREYTYPLRSGRLGVTGSTTFRLVVVLLDGRRQTVRADWPPHAKER